MKAHPDCSVIVGGHGYVHVQRSQRRNGSVRITASCCGVEAMDVVQCGHVECLDDCEMKLLRQVVFGLHEKQIPTETIISVWSEGSEQFTLPLAFWLALGGHEDFTLHDCGGLFGPGSDQDQGDQDSPVIGVH